MLAPAIFGLDQSMYHSISSVSLIAKCGSS